MIPHHSNSLQDFDLGSTPNLNPETVQQSKIDLTTAFAMVAESCKRDPAMIERLISMTGVDIIAAAKARKAPVRMPSTGIRAIECSISYSPPRTPAPSKNGKPQRVRKDRAKLDYYVKIQVFGPRSRGLTDPVWTGAAQLRSPDRAVKDARIKGRRSSLSDEYACWIEEGVAPVARENDFLIGFLMNKRKGEGTHFHEFQVILVNRQELEARALSSAIILMQEQVEEGCVSLDDRQTVYRQKSIKLPLFDGNTSGGKKLANTFILQSRGIPANGDRDDRATGLIELH
jgi:hypothetical protein